MQRSFQKLMQNIRGCRLCAQHFTHQPKPIVQLHPEATILIAGQAPGRQAHRSGIPFDDASGERLREWMGITREAFYDASRIAILPMGFCYPGHGPNGDLPPRPECAAAWRQQILDLLPNIQLTLLIGQYAMAWHLGGKDSSKVTERVRDWASYAPSLIPLPHPSPRNNRWLRQNPWFTTQVLPVLRAQVKHCLGIS